MALKTPEKSAPEKAPADVTVLLELALYTHYTWGGVTYEKGTAYKFTQEDAMLLMSEQDHGRPVWRQFTPARPRRAATMPIVDSTEVRAVRTRQSLEDAALNGGAGTAVKGKRIDVGTDDEIADVLNRPDDVSGDVTV